MSLLSLDQRDSKFSLLDKLARINWLIVLAICAIAGIGVAALYSVAGGAFDPWASRQAIRFLVALGVLLAVALIDIRVWMNLAVPIYLAALGLLILVEIAGVAGGGGQRWIDLKFMRLQPSELMKVAIVMVLARYYHGLTMEQAERVGSVALPLLLIAMPAVLIVVQPDLGTTVLVVAGGVGVVFLAGARLLLFGLGAGAVLAAIPIAWQFLRSYQKDRILTFLNPESDPLGAGYHIMQSKIALGSGGVGGKGFLQGTQSHLNFLPEMHTDFIFTMLAEEMGMLGGLVLLGLYLLVIGYGLTAAISAKSQFGRLMAMGLSLTVFLYVFINIAMVMGLLPVVGVPLPLVSYGGSATFTVMIALGLILNVAVHRDRAIPRRGH
ncbi:MAG: rod shape-determining protein RodA [Sphingomonadales bacterium]